jgi:hypothetical protein
VYRQTFSILINLNHSIGNRHFLNLKQKNVKWLFDEYDNIMCYVDIHCHQGLILYSWRFDQNQSSDPKMNFTNSSYDNVRGIDDDNEYREYLSSYFVALLSWIY